MSSNGGPKEGFKEGQIVWAKIKGYPWWPAVIGSISPDDPEICVNFLGDFS